MIRRAIMVTAIFGLAACGKNDPAAEPSAAPSEVSATPVAAATASEAAIAAPAANPAPAATAAAGPSVDFAKLAVNTRLEVTRQTQCREADPSKGSPWDLAPGVTVKFLTIEGAEAKVATLMSQCYLPADAVKLAQ